MQFIDEWVNDSGGLVCLAYASGFFCLFEWVTTSGSNRTQLWLDHDARRRQSDLW